MNLYRRESRCPTDIAVPIKTQHSKNMDIKIFISATIGLIAVAAVGYAVVSQQNISNERKRVAAKKEAEAKAKIYSDRQKAIKLRAKIKAAKDAETLKKFKKLESKYKCSQASCYDVCSIPDMEAWLAGNDNYEACLYVFNLKTTYKNNYQR